MPKTTTAKSLSPYIGREGVFITGALRVGIRVLDAREKFGRVDLLVSPLAGSGEEWKSLNDSIILNP